MVGRPSGWVSTRRTPLGLALLSTVLLAVLAALSGVVVGSVPSVAASARQAGSNQSQAREDQELSGTPVELSGNVGAASRVSSGTFLTTIPEAGGQGYLTIPRTVPGSTIWVGATALLPKGTPTGDGSIQINGLPNGLTDYASRCWLPIMDFPNAYGSGRMLTMLYNGSQEPECRQADSITLAVSAYQLRAAEGRPLQLTVWEEPPVTNPEGLPTLAKSMQWGELGPPGTPEKVTPGTSYATAPLAVHGTRSFRLAPGGYGVFRVPIEVGQHAQARVDVHVLGKVDGDLEVYPSFVSPMGGGLPGPELLDAPVDTFPLSLSEPSARDSIAIATPVITYAARRLGAEYGQNPLGPPGVAGDYYLVVYANDGVSAPGVDVTLQTGYFTDYAGGEPEYAAAAPPVPTVADFPDDGTTPDAAPSDSDGASVPWPLVLFLAVGAVLFAGLGVLLVRGRGPGESAGIRASEAQGEQA